MKQTINEDGATPQDPRKEVTRKRASDITSLRHVIGKGTLEITVERPQLEARNNLEALLRSRGMSVCRGLLAGASTVTLRLEL